jgi:hypothetical protein
MSSVEYVERAAWWSRELTRFRARGPGDTENAMRAIERDYGIDYWTVWRLRYRLSQIKDIGVSVYAKLEGAYFNECERQKRKLEAQLEKTKLARGPDYPLVVETETLLGREEAAEGDEEGFPT